MRFRHLFLSNLSVLALMCASAQAQETTDAPEVEFSPKKFYISNCFDAAIISTATQSGASLNGPLNTTVGTPRFTYFWNMGFNANFDFHKNIGVFTGLGIKNIGFIEKIKPLDSTIKRRVYTIGLPVGIKLGNIRKKNYVFLGGGVDVPFNYREKGFVTRGKKDKFNEWFSDRTAQFMPYAFAGVSLRPGFYVKVQYYPNNFMNPSYEHQTVTGGGLLVTSKPYALHDINVLMFSFGVDLSSKKMRIKKKDSNDNMM